MRTQSSSSGAALVRVLAWLPVGALTYHLKDTVLLRSGGYDLVAQLLHIERSADLSVWYKLALFRKEALLVGLLLPLSLFALVRWMSPRHGRVLVGTLGTVALVILYLELKTFWEVGTFLPFSILSGGIWQAGRQYGNDYMNIGSLVKFCILIGATFLFLWASARFDRIDRRWEGRPRRAVYLASVGLLVGLAGVTWLPQVPPNPYLSNVFVSSMNSFLGLSSEAATTREYEGRSPRQLLDQYRDLTRSPLPNAKSAYWAQAAGFDVLFFVLETAPAECLDLTASTGKFPNFEHLREHAFVGVRHFSTYPYTVRAVFSIYSSWYPSHSTHDFIEALTEVSRDLKAPGVIRSLADQGYSTAVFVPEVTENFDNDYARFKALGFQRQVVPKDADPLAETSPVAGDQRRSWRRTKDLQVLGLLESDLRRTIRSGHRYAYAFHPQYSHGPWPNASVHSTLDAICQEGRAIFQEEDRWMGRILQLLEGEGALDRTLVVVTGDHGFRTSTEYPEFLGGTLNDVSYRVPLLISAPGVLSSAVPIQWMTSHIDIAPSVLDLLGVSRERDLELGSPIWNPQLGGRTTFFYAQEYLGTDGFYSNGNIYMLKYIFGGVAAAKWTGKLEFAPSDLGKPDRALADTIRATLVRATSIQAGIARAMIPSSFDSAFSTAPRAGSQKGEN